MGMPWPLTGATHNQSELGLPDKGHAIKGLVVCNVGSLKGMGLRTIARCVVGSLFAVSMAIKLKYRNTPWIDTVTYHIHTGYLTNFYNHTFYEAMKGF